MKYIIILLIILVIGLLTIYTIANPTANSIIGLTMISSLLSGVGITLINNQDKLIN